MHNLVSISTVVNIRPSDNLKVRLCEHDFEYRELPKKQLLWGNCGETQAGELNLQLEH